PSGICRQNLVQVYHRPVLPEEGVRTATGSVRNPDHLAAAIDSQRCGAVTTERAQVGHNPSTINKAVAGIIRGVRGPNNLAGIVDCESARVRSAESSQVSNRTGDPHERM